MKGIGDIHSIVILITLLLLPRQCEDFRYRVTAFSWSMISSSPALLGMLVVVVINHKKLRISTIIIFLVDSNVIEVDQFRNMFPKILTRDFSLEFHRVRGRIRENNLNSYLIGFMLSAVYISLSIAQECRLESLQKTVEWLYWDVYTTYLVELARTGLSLN